MSEYDRSMPVMPDEPLESEEKSQLIGKTSTPILFSQDIIGVEIANHSMSAVIYVDSSGAPASTAKGIPIYPQGYYAIDKKILQGIGISVISDSPSTDVRIIGHFNLQSENV